MSDPLIAEFCRSTELAPHFLRKCQRDFRLRIQPMLDEREALLVEVAELRKKTEPKKRGRPRKHPATPTTSVSNLERDEVLA